MVNLMKALPKGVPKYPWLDLSWAQNSPHREKIAEESRRIIDTTARMKESSAALLPASLLGRQQPVTAVSRMDVFRMKEVVYAAVPRTERNTNLYDHLELAAEFNRQITLALQYNKENPPIGVQEASGFLHDAGKLAGVFRYHLHDFVGEHMLEEMNVRNEVRTAMQPSRFNVGPLALFDYKKDTEKNRQTKIEEYADAVYRQLTLPQKVGVIADVSGKRSKEHAGLVWEWDEMSATHLSSRKSADDYARHIGEHAIWPAETYAFEHMPDWALGWMDIYNRAKAELKARGADVDEIRKKVQDTVHLPAA